MAANDNLAYRFGDWLVEPVLNRVSRDGTEEQLEPLTMDVLAYLLAHSGQVVSSDEMLDALWGDRHGDPGMIQQRISQLRRVLGGEQSTYIETIRSRGYRAVASVEVVEEPGSQPDVTEEAESTPEGSVVNDGHSPNSGISHSKIAVFGVLLVAIGAAVWMVLGTKQEAEVVPVLDPIIAVLPFENLSADADNAYFADGMHSEILSNLTRMSGLKIISRASVMHYRDTEKRLPQIAEELGVNYFLAGDVQRSRDRVRIGVQLIKAAGEHQLWADNYDRELADVFKVQSDVARGVASELQVALEIGTLNAIATGKTGSIYAYQLYLRGQELRTETGEYEAALALFQEAVTVDPEFAQAYAAIAWTYRQLSSKNLEWNTIKEDLIAAAERGYEIDPFDPDVVMGMASIYSTDYHRNEESFENMTRYVDEALALAPNHRNALRYKMNLANLLGDHEVASATQRLILELDPLDPGTNIMMANKRRIEGRIEEAIEYIEKYVTVESSKGNAIAAGFYFNIGDFYHAVKYTRKDMRANPANLGSPFYLGQWLFFMREQQASDRMGQIMFEINPTHERTFWARSMSPSMTEEETAKLMADWKTLHGQTWFFNLIDATAFWYSANQAFDQERHDDAMADYEQYFQVLRRLVQNSMRDGQLIVGTSNSMYLDRYALAAKITGRKELWREMIATLLQYFETAPEKDYFQLAALHAMLGNIPQAVEHFRQIPGTKQMIPVNWRESLYGITKDRHGVFNGLGDDIGFQQALQEFRDINADALARVKADFPDLFVDTAEPVPQP